MYHLAIKSENINYVFISQYIFVFSQVKCSDVRVNGELTPKVIPMCFKAVYPVLYLVAELIRNWYCW